MRNFSKVVNVHYMSYSVNHGEYRNEVDIVSVLKDLAKAFETPYLHVLGDFTKITERLDYFNEVCCPYEVRVLRDLVDFMHYANSTDDKDLPYDVQKSFVYINLITGSSVIWVHAVL